ncbi:hypothetical protein Tco_0823953 [Tanacetum coccineum]|uniref:Uncharacterized protein n=1 Tax=Tanacetum coccineum TaxID=301880 RepID=A0ABQ5APF1_9ASTR
MPRLPTLPYPLIVDLPPWGFHLMEAYEPEVPEPAPHSLDLAPPAPASEYPKYVAPVDDDLSSAEDQPLPDSVSPTAFSPDYIADSEPDEDDHEEDHKMDPTDYPSEDEEEEEHLALAIYASDLPDSIFASEEIESFEEDGTALTPPSPSSPHHIILFFPYQTP